MAEEIIGSVINGYYQRSTHCQAAQVQNKTSSSIKHIEGMTLTFQIYHAS